MNQLMKFAVFGSQKSSSCSSLGAVSLFHSTSVCERKRRTRWDSAFGNFSSKRFNNYSKRMRKMESKRSLLHNISNYAEHLFQSWRDDDRYNSSSNGCPSWFQKQFGPKGANKEGSGYFRWGNYRNKRKGGIRFAASDDDDDDVETIFRSTFGGEGFFYWSFTDTENSNRRNSSQSANCRFSWKCSQTDDESETDGENSNTQDPELVSERQVLGLSPFGPLKIEEVKSAYRACALRWHPDRHQGSSKAAAEERFKHCSNAYKLLCDKLTTS